MKSNPDIFLLYEYMKRVSFTVRIKVILNEPADAKLLNQAAQEAIKRFPYFPCVSDWIRMETTPCRRMTDRCLCSRRRTAV